jgi:clan AA aspartic protease (TIGR02281 family)
MRQTASNYLKSGELDKALEAINQCIQDPTTAQDAKTWLLRGNIYLEISISTDEKIKALDADPVTQALDSYRKCVEYDTKKEYAEDVFQKINWQRNVFFNQAVDFYNKKDFKGAMLAFEKSANTFSVINISDTLSLFYAAACAGLANERGKAKEYYIQLIKANYKSPALYIALSDIYRTEKDSATALRVVREGLKEYPDDLKLFLAETNVYLTFNERGKALRNLKSAIAKDSTNPTVFFALGTIYDALSNETTQSAQEREKNFNLAVGAYTDALRLNQLYFDANYNIGALYVNKAASIDDIANKLPLDAETEFNKLKVEANAYLEKATPYLEKAVELQPNDLNTLFSLKQIFARTNNIGKLKEVNAKIEELQNNRGAETTTSNQIIINMEQEGGVFLVPCKINGLSLKFILDTGSSAVSISLVEASFMIKNNYLNVDDIVGEEKYLDANGNISVGTTILLKEIDIGGFKIYDVKANVVDNIKAPLLLGQSALQKFGKYEIEGNKLKISR